MEKTVENNSKVFVGNVPFHCTSEEFQECFKNMRGFVSADIILRYKSKLSRGFGFVIFSNEGDAENLLSQEIILNNRKLRFSRYLSEFGDSKQSGSTDISVNKPKVYQIFISNLPIDFTSDKLFALFPNELLENIVFCSIRSGINKNNNSSEKTRLYGIVGFNDWNSYNSALHIKTELDITIKKYRNKPTKKLDTNNTNKASYEIGFANGHTVGFDEGFMAGSSMLNKLASTPTTGRQNFAIGIQPHANGIRPFAFGEIPDTNNILQHSGFFLKDQD